MRDESIAANRTKSGTRLKTCSDSARFSWTKIRRKLGGRLSGEFSESISPIEAAIYYSKGSKQTRRPVENFTVKVSFSQDLANSAQRHGHFALYFTCPR
jgi:hypothetical protein